MDPEVAHVLKQFLRAFGRFAPCFVLMLYSAVKLIMCIVASRYWKGQRERRYTYVVQYLGTGVDE